MNTIFQRGILFFICALAQELAVLHAGSTINSTNHFAWDANCGWVDFRPERPNVGDGFSFGEFSCGGWLWSPNIGWINCGNGAPTNGMYYSNGGNSDFGVNHYGTGDLYGLAWAPNIGWVSFDWWVLTPANSARPHVNLRTGEFSGYAWSPNCGWIVLGAATMKTDRMDIVDTDHDGISDAFEQAYVHNLTTMTDSSDTDGDGQSDQTEYIALTNPLVQDAPLKINRVNKLPGVNSVEMEWTSSPARVYDIQAKLNLPDPAWLYLASVPGAAGASTAQAIEMGVPRAYFRIAAKLPLQP